MSLSTACNLITVAGAGMTATAAVDIITSAGRDWSLAAAHDVTAAASNAIGLTALSNVSVAAVAQDVTITAGRTIAESAGSNITLSAASNLSASAGLAVSATAGTSLTLASGTDMVLDSAARAEISAEAGIQLYANNSTIQGLAGVDVSFSASNNVNLTAIKDVISTAGQDLKSFVARDALLQVTGAVTQTSASASTTATNGVQLTSTTSNVAVTAGQDIVQTATRHVSTSAGANITASAVGIYELQAASLALTSTSSNILVNSASNLTYAVPADNSHTFDIGSTHVLTLRPLTTAEKASGSNITNHKLVINADFDVAGVVNSTSVQQTVLEVADKLIHLAFNSNLDAPYDGAGNEGAGLVIDGIPAGMPATQDSVDRYEKSIRWHQSTDGVPALGTSGDPTTEAYWEVKGGALRISQQIAGDNVKFCFRINNMKELEIWKADDYATSASGTPFACKRVAKFGRVM
jgi:hypothetical protein